MNLKDITTPKELAKKLNITEQTVLQWRKSGMPFIKIGKLIFILQNSFLRWIKGLEITESSKNHQDAPGREI